MRSVNDARYLIADCTRKMERVLLSQEIDVQFLKRCSHSPPKTFSSCRIYSMQTLRNIGLGEKRLENYGKDTRLIGGQDYSKF